MNKQVNILWEMSVIAAIIVLASLVVWKTTPIPQNNENEITQEILIDEMELPSTHADSLITHSQKIFEAQKARWSEGKSLFKINCASCHNPKVNQTGPALMGVAQHWNEYKGKSGEQWLHEATRNWSLVVKAGYPYAVKLTKDYNKEMDSFPEMNDKDIDEILDYAENSEQFHQINAY